MRDYGYITEWPLPACDHPVEWVQTKTEDMVDFKGKGNPTPEYRLRTCHYLNDDIDLGQEGIMVESLIVTLLHDIIAEDPKVKFSHCIDFQHFTNVSRHTDLLAVQSP